ncbi:hypothetical protein H2789_03890 [Acinetobacter calcoaceticus]
MATAPGQRTEPYTLSVGKTVTITVATAWSRQAMQGTDTAVVTIDTTAPKCLDAINATDPVSGTAEAGSTIDCDLSVGTTATVVLEHR